MDIAVCRYLLFLEYLVLISNENCLMPPRLDLYTSIHYHSTMSKQIVTSSPDIMGGTPVFAGTRVPVQTLVDYIKGGESIDDFLEGFPTVSKEQVIAFLDKAQEEITKMVA